jgi:hypothetical protein
MRKSLLAGLAAATLLAAPSLAVAQEPDHGETFGSLGWVTIPGAPLVSFDISWVDQLETAGAPGLNMYFLADRSNASIDLFHIQVNPQPLKLTVAAPNQFAGNVPTCPVANACNGPNGVMTLLNPGSGAKELWAGDGPTMTPGIGTPVCPTSCSTVKVFDSNGTLTHVISTGGVFRADELCFVKPGFYPAVGTVAHGIVAVANDADSPPYMTFIATDGPSAYQRIGAPFLIPTASNGVEQCQFDPRIGLIYLNIPDIGGAGDDQTDGAVFIFDPAFTPPLFLAAFDIPVALCAGPQGMAIGPVGTGDILLGCNAPTVPPGPPSGVPISVVISNSFGCCVAALVGQGGSDEVWFDPLAKHYFLANGGSNPTNSPTQTLGITDATSNAQDQNIFLAFTGGTTRRTHSTASWSGAGLGSTVTAAFVPIPPVGGTPTPPFNSTVCGSSALQGCIGVFGTVPIPVTDPADGN